MARGKHSREELEQLLASKREARRQFAREHRGPWRETLVEAIDERKAEALREIESTLALVAENVYRLPIDGPPGSRSLLRLEALSRFGTGEGIETRLRRFVSELPAEAFPKLGRAEAERRDDELGTEIEGLEEELREAERAQAHAEVDTEFAARP